MTDRPKAQSEGDLHSSMYAKEILGGTARGGAAGAALGALLKHTGHGVGPTALGSAGAILGGIHGGLKGRERSLRDVVTQQRMHDRAEARRKPKETKEATDQYETRKWAAFTDELTKEALALPGAAGALGSLGQGIMTAGSRVARGLGMQQGFGQALRTGGNFFGGGMIGRQRLGQAVGAGTLALGGAALAGRATG